MQRLSNRLGRSNVRQDDDNVVPAQDAQPGPSGSAAGSSRARVAGLPARVGNGAGSALRRGQAAPTLGTLPLSYDAQLAQWESAAPAGEEAARRTAVERVQRVVGKWLTSKLDLSELGLTSLPPLPDKLKHLIAHGNRLTALPVLPSSLTILSAFNNRLMALPELPSKLDTLCVSDNALTALPVLPQSLESLSADNNLLQIFPIYPKKLRNISINENPFDPAFCPPRELYYDFYCDTLTKRIRAWQSKHPQIADQTIDQSFQAYIARLVHWVHDAPAGEMDGRRKAVYKILVEVRNRPPDPQLTLDFNGLGLTSLPELPARLKRLYCCTNQLTILPELPVGLQDLRCFRNRLNTISVLPVGLLELNCSDNDLTTLPALPARLQKLDCTRNQLTTLPELPVELNNLKCGHNQLTSLPELSARLNHLECDHNQLTTLPLLPAGLQTARVDGNPNLELPPRFDFAYRSNYIQELRLWQRDNLQGRIFTNARSVVDAFVGYLSWGIDRIAPVHSAVAPAPVQSFNPAAAPHPWHLPEVSHLWRFTKTENNAASFNQFSRRLTQTAEYTNPAPTLA